MKLKKIKLRSAVELNDSEMKAVRGSYYGYDDEPIGCYLAHCACSASDIFSEIDRRNFTFQTDTPSSIGIQLESSRICRDKGFRTSRCDFVEAIGYSRCQNF